MTFIKSVLTSVAVAAFAISCNESSNSTNRIISSPKMDELIPKPAEIKPAEGGFEIKQTTTVYVVGTGEELASVAQMFVNKLNTATGYSVKVEKAENTEKNGIYFQLTPGSGSAEGYNLSINQHKIIASANAAAGLFYASQTLRQLLPHEIELNAKTDTTLTIAAGTIIDQPDYGVRGSMLDVARHFFSVEDVKRYIDFLAMYKMNTLHLHLADDQGWRIEIKSWPKLTEIGGSTQVGGGKGGFYTQEQYKDIVKYAQERFISIIPEIDMPGHTNAALASYPELNCNNKATKLYTGTEVGFSTLCTGKEITYKFIDDVVGEIAALSPGAYIHIGGDESHATKKEDYIPFVNKVQAIVKKHNKQVIGWDEIALSTLTTGSVAQFWADSANSVNAIKQGAKIMMSPAKKAYLDMKYDSTTKLGLKWAAYIEVKDGYDWDPANYVKGISKENIYGIEAALWSETVSTMNEIEFLVFPRLPGYAEIGWTATSNRSWEEYKVRLGKHAPRMKAMQIDFYPSKQIDWKN